MQEFARSFGDETGATSTSWPGERDSCSARRGHTSGSSRQGLGWREVNAHGVHGEWLTPANAARGVILYIHGGGFVACSAATNRPITASLARRTSSPVFSANYRLAPEHAFPAAFDDVVAT